MLGFPAPPRSSSDLSFSSSSLLGLNQENLRSDKNNNNNDDGKKNKKRERGRKYKVRGYRWHDHQGGNYGVRVDHVSYSRF